MHNHTVRARKAAAAISRYSQSNANKKDKLKRAKQEEACIEEDGDEIDWAAERRREE
jgi:hypothetical protein